MSRKKKFKPKKQVSYKQRNVFLKVSGVVMVIDNAYAYTDDMVGRNILVGWMEQYKDGTEYLRKMAFQFANTNLRKLNGVKYGDEVEITFSGYSMKDWSMQGRKYYKTTLQGINCKILKDNGGNTEWAEYLWHLDWERNHKGTNPVYPKDTRTDREKRIDEIRDFYNNAKKRR